MKNWIAPSIESFLVGLYGGRHPQIKFSHVAENVYKNITELPKIYAFLFSVLFLVFDYLVPLLSFKPPLHRCSDEVKILLIKKWYERSPFLIHLGLTGLKYLCVTELYLDPVLQKEMGYSAAFERRTKGEC